MSNLAIHGGSPVFDRQHRWPVWPAATADDERRVLEAVRGSAWGLGSPITTDFARKLEAALGVKHALPVNSGTAALELAIKSLRIGPGDEVIVPAYTFVASATCVLEMGATVVFADADLDTLNLCPREVARLITPRTKAVIAVHFGGNPCDIDGLERAIAGRPIALIEDAAHAHGMLLKGKPAGKHGVAACYSYQSSKNMACGEGGAFVTDDSALFESAVSFHSFGRKAGRPWYEHHNLSWNHRLTGLQSALLLGQLERLESQTQIRYENAALLTKILSQIPGVKPQKTVDSSPDTRRAFHLFIWRHEAATMGVARDVFCRALEAEGVPCFGGYPIPLQENPMFQEHRYWHHHREGVPAPSGEPDYRMVKTPNVSAICKDAVWLQHQYLLAPREQVQKIGEAIVKVAAHAKELRND